MKRILVFFSLAFLIAWLFWVPMALNRLGQLGVMVPVALGQSVGAYAPLFAAVLTQRWLDGPSPRAMFRAIRLNRAMLPWALLAFLIPLLTVLLATLTYTLTGLHPSSIVRSEILRDLGWFTLLILPIQFITAMLGSAAGEEPGWRGYALPALLERFPPLVASLLLGTLWGVWHFPLLIASGGQPSIAFLLGIIGNSLILDKLYLNANRNLLVALLYHQSVNTAITFLVGGLETPITLGLIWATVVIVRLLPSELAAAPVPPAHSAP